MLKYLSIKILSVVFLSFTLGCAQIVNVNTQAFAVREQQTEALPVMLSQDLPTLSSQTSIEALHPAFIPRLRVIIAELRKAGYEPVIASGCRSKAEQAEKVRKGYSRTMNSDHVVGKDGYCRAVDLVDRRYLWKNEHIKEIEAYRETLKLILRNMEDIKWGGYWLGFGRLGDWAHIAFKP